MKSFKNSGLTYVLLFIFLISLAGQLIFGFHSYNEELRRQGNTEIERIGDYLISGHFIGSVGENWESEFLQMALFVWLTAFLYQKGSAVSKKTPEERGPEDYAIEVQEHKHSAALRKKYGRVWVWLYEYSLTLVLAALFIVSLFMHAYGTLGHLNAERLAQGEPPTKFMDVFFEHRFWFESFQNWQSEFFSIALIGLLSIFLRHKGSPQSKPLHAKHSETKG